MPEPVEIVETPVGYVCTDDEVDFTDTGRSLYEVQHLLGHTQVKTTERYAHLQQDALMKAANVVAALVGTAAPPRPLAGLIGG